MVMLSETQRCEELKLHRTQIRTLPWFEDRTEEASLILSDPGTVAPGVF